MQEGEQYAKENNLFFLETSAKTAQNVNELFYEIGKFFSLPRLSILMLMLSDQNKPIRKSLLKLIAQEPNPVSIFQSESV